MFVSIIKIPHKLERAIEQAFTKVGLFVGRNPWPNILIPLILGLSLSFGLLRFEEINEVRLQFTPYNSPSHYEQRVMDEFLKHKGQLYFSEVIIVPKLKKSLLESETLEETFKFVTYLQKSLTVEIGHKNYSFLQICRSYCQSNDAVTVFLAAYKSPKKSGNLELKYPVMEVFGESLYLANSLHGVSTDKFGNINSVKLISLQFLSIANKTMKGILFKWEMELIKTVKNMNGKHIKAVLSTESLIQSEVRRSGMSAAPYLMLSFMAVVSFTVLTSLRFEIHRSKPWESFAGVIAPLIATAGSFGLLLLTGLKYQPIVSVTIFLILAVGVDDVFLMLQAWHKSDPTLSVVERMGKTLDESGPSITITSLTNALSFGVGILSQTPAIRTFCIYTLTAIIMSYLFQLSLFSGLLTLSGRRETKQLDPCCFRVVAIKAKKETGKILNFFTTAKESLMKYWIKFIVSWPTRIIILIFLLAYWSIAVWGFTKLRVGIVLSKLVMADSPLNEYEDLFLKHVWTETQQLTVIINSPGDMRNLTQLQQIQALVKDFEASSKSAGSISTQFWLADYLSYLRFFDIKSFQYTRMAQFSRQTSNYLSAQLRLHKTLCKNNKPKCLQAFMFTTGFTNVTNYSERKELLDEWRAICHNHSNLNVSVYDYHSFFADQIQSIKETTRLTVAVALVCMALVCVVFIPNLVSILCAAICVVSVNLGVIGFLTHWNVDLDPISMTGILVSIGFSVDFTAHMSYHYYKGNGLTSTERLVKAYDSIGWPTLQSGLSTMLAIVVLFMHDSYLITVFVKTVVLVCTFGLIHGLLILPVGLAALPFRKQSDSNSISLQ